MKINIEGEILKKLQRRVEETDEFDSIETYINYLLAQIVKKIEAGNIKTAYSAEDEMKIKKRLKALGYLD